MVNYLKKTKLRLLLLRMGYPVPALKDCEYKFYRGSEWLYFTGTDGFFYDCFFSKYLSVDKNDFDELKDCYYRVDRNVYYGSQVKEFLDKLEV